MSTPIVTLEEYKLYATIKTINVALDDQINQILPGVTQFILDYCGRKFVDYYNTDKEEYKKASETTIYTDEFPIRSITSIAFSGDNGTTYTTLANGVDYILDKQTDSIVILTPQYAYGKGYNAFKLFYKAGMAEYPDDLKLACMDLVTYYMKSDMAVKSTRSPGSNTTQVEYVLNSGLPSHIRRVLDRYREVH